MRARTLSGAFFCSLVIFTMAAMPCPVLRERRQRLRERWLPLEGLPDADGAELRGASHGVPLQSPQQGPF